MHRIQKVFIIRKKGGGGSGGGGRSGGGMESKPTSRAGSVKPRPRLERRNALKNIDYELPSTSSFSSSEDSLSSSLSGAAAGAQRSRSLDIYPLDKQTSFRIEGKEGEFELLCQSLGFSGIEDFCIPTEEWEAMKIRSSSDVLPRLSRIGNSAIVSSSVIKPIDGVDNDEAAVKDISAASPEVISEAIEPEIEGFDIGLTDNYSTASSRITDVMRRKIELNHSRFSDGATTSTRSIDATSQKIEVNGFGVSNAVATRTGNGSLCSVNDIIGSDVVCPLPDRIGCSVRVSDVFLSKSELIDFPDNGNEGVEVIGRNGIKGARPPALAPPPAMSLPVIDSACSTWDILRAFAPQEDITYSRFEVCQEDSSEDDDGQHRNMEEEEVRCVVTSRRIGGESGLLSESCSFTTTSNDDDSSSTTTEPMSNISPNGRFRFIIKPWQQGGLLGRGSFGSVYEGIAR